MSLPPVRIEENIRLIGHHALNGYPNVGEGMAMKIVGDQRYLYAANDRSPGAFSVLDVSAFNWRHHLSRSVIEDVFLLR
jgi:hypothetical protein